MQENEKQKNMFVIIVVVVLAALGIFLYVKSQTGLKTVNNTSEKMETSKSVPSETGINGETSQSTKTPDGTTVQNTEAKVEIKGFAFNPATITVKVGTKVTWTNQDAVAHTATSVDGKSFDTVLLNQGETGSFTFDKVGTYDYICTPHPKMQATIIVVE